MSESGALATLPDPTLIEESPSISFRFSKRTWTILGAVALLAGILGAAFTFTIPARYVVTRTFIVIAGNNATDNDTLIRGLEAILSDRGFATELKARAEITDLSAEEIKAMISIDRPALSPNLNVAVSAPERGSAEQISAEVEPTLTAMFQRYQEDIPVEQRIPGPIVKQIYGLPTVERTYTPWWAGLLTGSILAFVLAFVVATLRQYRAPTLGSVREVSAALDLPVLARVAAVGDGRSTNPQDAVLSMLAAVERLGARGPIHRLVIVAPEADPERSRLVLALGCAIARNFDQPVALIDADLENASLSTLVGAADEPGLAECLSGELRVDQTLLRLENGHTPAGLAGMVPPDGMIRVMPAGMDRSGSVLRMRSNLHQVLGALSGRYVVVIDGPQVPGPVPITQLLSMSDATLVVVTEGGTSIRDARYTGDALRSYTGSPVGAVVLKK